MKKQTKTRSGAGKIVLISLIIAALITGVALTGVYLAKKWPEFRAAGEDSNFYVRIEGIKIADGGPDLKFDPGRQLRVDCVNTAGDYDVKVVPNVGDSDFDFTVDGLLYKFGAETDLTAGFDIKKYDDHFVISNTAGSVSGILSRVYPGREISVPEVLNGKSYFTVIVTSGGYVTRINLNIPFIVDIQDIELDNIQIVF